MKLTRRRTEMLFFHDEACIAGIILYNHVMLSTEQLLPAHNSPRTVPLRAQVADWLFRKILSGEYGTGTRLVLNRISNELGVSATPVREAMVTLESLGMLSFRHNCGATVRPFGVKQVEEIYQVWNVLNSAVYRMACGRIAREALVSLHDDLTALRADPEENDAWSQRETELDHRLESLVESGADCQRLIEEMSRYRELTETFREVFGSHPEHQREALHAHIQIVEALLDGESEIVASLVTRHNRWCAQSLLDAFRQEKG